jgi:predicted HTH transcriptional regulator
MPGLDKKEFLAGRSMPRNRELMRVFKDLKFVEQLGSGIRRILKVYNERVFNISDNFLEISFPFESNYIEDSQTIEQNKIQKTREKTREKILNLIYSNSYITTIEIAEIVGITIKGVEYHLSKLKKEDCLERIGPDKGGYWKIKK